MSFTAPELLVPHKFGKKDAMPTTQADIYAFGLVIFQVCEQDCEDLPWLYIHSLQVLTGELPFHGIQQSALVYVVVQEGKRPDKPQNASSIGLSDLLWSFVQRCWDADMKLRPGAGEVVAHLGAAAATWGELVPPSAQVENIASGTEEMSDSARFSEFDPLTPP